MLEITIGVSQKIREMKRLHLLSAFFSMLFIIDKYLYRANQVLIQK